MTLRAPSLLSLSLLLSTPALAQTTVPGFNLERLSPEPANVNSLLVSTGDGLPQGTARFSLILHYERDPLVYIKDGVRAGAVVGSRFTAHLGGAYAVADWLELGLGLPLVLRQAGDDLTGYGISPVSASVVGSPLVQGRFTVLRESLGSPMDLGLSVGLTVPIGSESSLNKDPGSGVTFIPRLGAGRTVGTRVRVGAEIGAVVRGQATLSPYAETVADQVGSMLSLAATVSTLGTGLRGELDIRGLVPLSQTGSSVEVLGGVRYAFMDRLLEVYALLGPGFGPMPGTPMYRVLGGLSWTPLAPQPCVEGRGYSLAECPALDRDTDGVRNGVDRCPEQAGVAALDGCADQDDDGDGVLNLADTCPRVAGPSGQGGCPVMDADGDGIPDAQDKCPQEKGLAGGDGCAPVVAAAPPPDADGDGIPDAQDKCPQEKGPAGGDGCAPAPDVKSAVKLETGKISITEKVTFQSGKAEILESSFPLLRQVAELLKAHPELTKVRVEGHTDNSGKRTFNVSLSQKRAEAVKKFLVGQGIAPSRLDARGFGPDRPLASNDDPSGKELNRRVEFTTDF